MMYLVDVFDVGILYIPRPIASVVLSMLSDPLLTHFMEPIPKPSFFSADFSKMLQICCLLFFQ